MLLGPDQDGEILLSETAGLHDALDRRDRIRRLYRPALGSVSLYEGHKNLKRAAFRCVGLEYTPVCRQGRLRIASE